MPLSASNPARNSAYQSGALALLLAAAAILIALAYEHIGGYAPCELCLMQRYAFYAGVPALFVALVAYSAGQRAVAALLFGLVGLAFLGNAGLAAYHAGVEWRFWEGPSGCTGSQALTTSAGNLLEALQQTHVVRCDEAAWRFLGVSFAGWNVVCSLLIMWLSFSAMRRAARAA